MATAKKQSPVWIGYLFYASVVGFGLWLFGFNVWGISLALRSRGWPATPGTILSSDVCESYSKSGTEYYPCLKYQYVVAGKSLEGNQIYGVHRQPGSYDAALQISQKYPMGEQVSVYYDPASPATACLEPGAIPWETYGAMATGLFFIGFVIYLTRLSFRRGNLESKNLPSKRVI